MAASSPLELAPQDWITLRRLLREALDLPLEHRDAWLHRLDEVHAIHRPHLRALLAHADDAVASPILATLPKVETAAFAPAFWGDGVAHAEGARVGPYRLLRLLGEGGMGSVWLAERTDMLQGRPVALKLPRQSGRIDNLAERMAREREILAALDHPNIARLYDAGITADGQPFLALEVVEGHALDDHAARHSLDVPASLRLFLQVLRAVAHAHARLAVHRDLKPSNILVDNAGQAKLLDFGVAKLLAEGVAVETELTQQAGRALTLHYASPEQIAGLPLDTRTDIYSLGVVLFELLTRQRPYRLARESRGALEDAIAHQEPPRPSSVETDPARQRALRGDIDTIVLKALKKLPAERYATVDAFANDIERHLRNEAVLAQPDSRAYRLRKFVARNTLPVGAASAVLLAVVLGSVLAIWQARVAFEERDRAREVRGFIESIFRDADPYGEGREPMTVATLLQRAHERVDRDLLSRPAIRVEMLDLIGNGQKNLQETKAALSTLDDAVAAAQEAFGAEHALTLRARVSRLEAYRFGGKLNEMRAELQQLLPMLRTRESDAENLVVALEMQAHLSIDEGHYAEAVSAATEALEIASVRLGDSNPHTAVAATLLALGFEYSLEPARAKATALRALDLTLKSHPGDALHPDVIGVRVTLARAMGELGELRPCLQLFDEVIRATIERFGPTAIEVAFHTHGTVKFLVEAGEVRRAQQAAARAAEIFRLRASADTHFYPLARASHAMTLLAARRADLAISEIESASSQVAAVMGATHPVAQRTREDLALAQVYLGRAAQADATLRQDAASAPASWRRLLVQSLAATQRGEHEAAVRLAQQSLDATAGPRAPMWRMRVLPRLALAMVEAGQFEQAESAAQEAMALLDRVQLTNSPEKADAALALGRARLGLARASEALPSLQQADDFWREFEPTSRWAGEAAFWLAHGHEALGQPAPARAAFARAAELLARSPIPADAALSSNARRAAAVHTASD